MGILFLGCCILKNMYLFLHCVWVMMSNVPISRDLYPSPLSVLIKEHILLPRTRNKVRGPTGAHPNLVESSCPAGETNTVCLQRAAGSRPESERQRPRDVLSCLEQAGIWTFSELTSDAVHYAFKSCGQEVPSSRHPALALFLISWATGLPEGRSERPQHMA